MFIKTIIDPQIRVSKLDEFMSLPKTIWVKDFDAESAKTFADNILSFDQEKQPVLPIIIDSPGGQVYSLLNMIDVLKTVKIPIATIALGKAMSCGSVLLTCRTWGYRYAAPNATILLHEVSSWAHGKTSDIKVDAAETERLNKFIFELMDKNCKKPKGYFLKLLKNKNNADLFITSSEAKKHGIVNSVGIPSFKVSVKVETTFG